MVGINAQTQTIDELLKPLELNQALYPPEDILSTKSIVLLSVPEGSNSSEWQILVDELQLFFSSAGLDAMAWLDVRDYESFQNSVEPLPEILLKREPKNIVFFQIKDEESPVFLAIGPFNGKPTLWNRGTAFWARQSMKLEGIINELSSLFKTGQFVKDNLLVNEYAEFFTSELTFGLTARSIPPRILEFKTYIDLFDMSYFDQNGIQKLNFEFFNNADSVKQEIRERNYGLESLTSDSTSGIFLRDKTKTTQQLRREGFQYHLRYIRAKETVLSSLIPFEDRPAPTEKYVYKFYLDDLRNNNNYVGKEWDAHPDWNTALSNFLAQIELVRSSETN